MIVDDFDDLELFASLPHCIHGSILFTTRSKVIASFHPAAVGVQVTPITKDKALALVLSSLIPGEEVAGQTVQESLELVGALEYWPLAISHSGMAMRVMDITLSQFLELSRWQH